MNWISMTIAACTVACCGTVLLPSQAQAADNAALENKVNAILKQMTLDEKLTLLSGNGSHSIRPIPRLGVPSVTMPDGPQGVRGGTSTAFPAGICVASTWNPDLVSTLGAAIGRETIAAECKGDIILGPCINIHRTPLGGRNCESYSEDPYLAARIAVAYIEGVQSQGAGACVKHYACNDQEWERGSINVKVGERALREIYLPAFRAAATEAHVLSLMTSYNCVNGPHSSANKYLVTDILKNEWGWDGFVMSDWGGVHETAAVLNAGNDLEMPGGEHFTLDNLHKAIDSGEIKLSTVDESARRILRGIVRLELLDGEKKRDPSVLNCDAHRKIAEKVADEGIVLLKNNDSVLPLDAGKVKSIAIIGPYASELQSSVMGSGNVPPVNPVSPIDGVKKIVGDGVQVNYEPGIKLVHGKLLLPAITGADVKSADASDGKPGFKAEYFANKNLEGTPALTKTDDSIDFNWTGKSPDASIPASNYSVRWTGYLKAKESGEYKFEAYSDDGTKLYIDGNVVIDNWGDHGSQARTAKVNLEAGKTYKLCLEYYNGTGDAVARLGMRAPYTVDENTDLINAAAGAAAKSDVAVIFAGVCGDQEGEGVDRSDFELPSGQNELIKAVSAANKNTVVVMFGGTTSDLTQWVDKVPALLQAWYPGVMGGNAIADILFGNVNPSGKLPDTFGRHRNDYADCNNYPGGNGEVKYAEGIYVGYRHFDKAKIQPLFPFGHGLSYTTFKYSNIAFDMPKMHRGEKVKVSITLTNTGKRAGAEVAQLYISELHPTVDRPVRELKGFKKVFLNPGQSKTVSFNIDESSLSFYNVDAKKWTANSGKYEISVGSSSRDLRLKKTLELM